MNIYIVEYWVPFPSSEYGGVVIMAANTEGMLKQLAWEHTSLYDRVDFPNGQEDLVLEYKLIGTGNYDVPQIIHEFIT